MILPIKVNEYCWNEHRKQVDHYYQRYLELPRKHTQIREKEYSQYAQYRQIEWRKQHTCYSCSQYNVFFRHILIISYCSYWLTYSLRRRATGKFNCSLYLATVRLAIGKPFSFITFASASSLSGFCLFSLLMMSRKATFYLFLQTSLLRLPLYNCQ